MRAAKQFGWSKAELIANISAAFYEKIVLDNGEEICYGEERMENDGAKITFFVCYTLRKILRYIRYRKINRKKHRRRWHAIAIPLVDLELVDLEMVRQNHFECGDICIEVC